ncbi:DUF5060 domain-containing protein [Algisphaera agarilytica]|uniref:DUF4038 domain-containing protein n=1 Tax=Algisphaera agarilytica TaxID=1385975 RepID=A0A7X0LL16_9BACT|nr:DUF5060 domain-containing protein [Algisphaera agarilytica]MBB6430409.1 hypothetical protein [Algisphaera agarilytica]
MDVKKWQVVDLKFSAAEQVAQPFEVEFAGRFVCGDRELVVPGFYNGGQEWVLRFSAPAEGAWEYTTTSSLESLAGKTGQLMAGHNTNPRQHGGLVLNPESPQEFFYEDGSPCFVLAFEADWMFALDYDNAEDAPKSRQLLDHLVDCRVNQAVLTVYSYDVDWPKDAKLADHPEHEYGGRDDIYPFGGSNSEPDFSTLNVAFFQKFDRVVALMNERGITAHLMIYVWNKLVQWPDAESLEDNRYFDYIIKRYQAYPNVVWDVSKEALNNARCSEDYGRERIERIRNLDAYGRLVTVHDGGFCERNAELVDFISWQHWSASIYDKMLAVYEKYPTQPVFNIEHGGYELSHYEVFPGDYTNPELCLRRNWLIQFAGVYTTYYWQGAAWNVLIHSPFDQPDGFPEPRFEYYRHFADFFAQFPVSRFKPEPGRNFSSFCMSDGEGTLLYYIPQEHEKLSVYLAQPEGTIQWFNTLTGQFTERLPSTAPFYQSPWRGEADAVVICRTKDTE